MVDTPTLKIKDDGMGLHEGDENCKNPGRKKPSEGLRSIWEDNIKKCRLSIVIFRLRIGPGGGFLRTQYRMVGFHKRRRISLTSRATVGSQDGLCSVGLVR